MRTHAGRLNSLELVHLWALNTDIRHAFRDAVFQLHDFRVLEVLQASSLELVGILVYPKAFSLDGRIRLYHKWHCSET